MNFAHIGPRRGHRIGYAMPAMHDSDERIGQASHSHLSHPNEHRAKGIDSFSPRQTLGRIIENWSPIRIDVRFQTSPAPKSENRHRGCWLGRNPATRPRVLPIVPRTGSYEDAMCWPPRSTPGRFCAL